MFQGKTWLKRDQQYPWVLVDAFLGVMGLYFLEKRSHSWRGDVYWFPPNRDTNVPEWIHILSHCIDVILQPEITSEEWVEFFNELSGAPGPNCQAPPHGDWWLIMSSCSVLPILWQAMEAMQACYWSWLPEIFPYAC